MVILGKMAYLAKYSNYCAFQNHVNYRIETIADGYVFRCRQSNFRRFPKIATDGMPTWTNMVRKYGTALHWRVVFLDVIDHLSPQQIANVLKVGKTFVHGILKLYRETKGVDYLPNLAGMQHSVTGKCR